MRLCWLAAAWGLLLPLWTCTAAMAQASSPAPTASPAIKAGPPAYASDPDFVAALAEAKRLDKQHHFPFAVDAYKRPIRLPAAKALIASWANTWPSYVLATQRVR